VLDINDKEVQFYEFPAIRTDSINSISNGASNYPFPFAKLKRMVASDQNLNYFFVADNYFAYESTDEIKWQIQPETKVKENWKLQRATTNFAGRNWEAWFTSDIPFSEGPHKFKGLPGLVVEIKDTKNNFNFELLKIERPKYANPQITETLFKKKPLVVTFDKFKEIMLAHYSDPYSRFRTMRPGFWSIARPDKTYVRTVEGLAKITREDQEEMRRNNNPIELTGAVKYPLK
jgi:GLPGLI family protein